MQRITSSTLLAHATKKSEQTIYFETREESRIYCANYGISQRVVQKNHPHAPKERRWFLPAYANKPSSL